MAGIVGQKINGTTKPYKIPYGTSPTEASAQTKTVSIPGIVVLEAGLSTRVLFSFRQGYDGTPKLNVNDLGAKDIKLNSTDNAGSGSWAAGEVVDFYYNGTNWVIASVGTTVIDDTAGEGDTGKVWSVGKLVDEFYGKADKVASATADNFAGLDASGNLTDSGKKPMDFVAVNQGSANAGKYMKVGSDGTLSPEDIPETEAVQVTATALGWTGNEPKTNTISVTGVTAGNNIIVGVGGTITSEQLYAVIAGEIVCTAQGAGTITLTAFGTTPAVDIPIVVMIVK